jgi:hypothetical protein
MTSWACAFDDDFDTVFGAVALELVERLHIGSRLLAMRELRALMQTRRLV